MSRSFVKITEIDLRRLGKVATTDRQSFYQRNPQTALLYNDRLFAVALCQGGALHYVDGKNGIKDLDVYTFYVENPVKPFPYRRRGVADFGDPKFGTSEDSPHFIGRRVDLIGRSLKQADPTDPIGSIQRYLSDQRTDTARFLSKKAVVLIEPNHLLGNIIWPRAVIRNDSSQ